jgi:REP element-mobilizing transposase RayT
VATRAQTFFSDDDYTLYRHLLGQHCRAAQVSVWAWVLMPNHVHLILVPADADGIRRALSKVHRAYAGHIHTRLKRTGHFWQGRFGCVVMDEAHLARISHTVWLVSHFGIRRRSWVRFRGCRVILGERDGFRSGPAGIFGWFFILGSTPPFRFSGWFA